MKKNSKISFVLICTFLIAVVLWPRTEKKNKQLDKTTMITKITKAPLLYEKLTESKSEFRDIELTTKEPYKPLAWEKQLSQFLVMRQPAGTKVLIKDRGMKHTPLGHHRQVAVSILHTNKTRGDFHALVDIKSGKILTTWDRSSDTKGVRGGRNWSKYAPSGSY